MGVGPTALLTRGSGSDDGVGDAEVLAILGKMTKQRQESVRAYEEGLSAIR